MQRLKFLSVFVLLVLLISAGVGVVMARESDGLVLDAMVEGLVGEDVAELQLLPDRPDTAASLSARGIMLPKLKVQNDTYRIINLADIPDGTYKVVVDAPSVYLCEPKGYLFQVSGGWIVRNPELPLHFKLISPPASTEKWPPCRELVIQVETSPSGLVEEQKVYEVYRGGRLVDLSGPPKQPERGEQGNGEILDATYYYVGPKTTQDNNGVWGRNYVVDPDVSHSFVAERVYASNEARDKWMEAGWAEVSWRDDKQYVYEYDSVNNQWNFFDEYDLSTGSAVETEVYYNSGVSKWRALYYEGNNRWRVLVEEPLGFTTAGLGYNRGEIHTTDGCPTLPRSSFDKGYLYLDGVWRIWDTRYETIIESEDPYHVDMINEYYRFDIYSQ